VSGVTEEQPTVDLAAVARDDLLLDSLGQGSPAPGDDEVAAMLAAWRADLADDLPEVRKAVPAVLPAADPAVRRVRRWSAMRVTLAAAAVVVAFLGGLVVAAGGAGPDSPLWSITQVVYGDRADSRLAERDAERTIQQARDAVAAGQPTEAEELLDQAESLIDRVTEPTVAQRLRDEVDAIRRLLSTVPGLLNPTPGPTPGVGTTPTPAPGAPGGGPTPGRTGGGDGGNPPGLPLPSLPLPSLPLPSLPLPSLPLPSLPIVG